MSFPAARTNLSSHLTFARGAAPIEGRPARYVRCYARCPPPVHPPWQHASVPRTAPDGASFPAPLPDMLFDMLSLASDEPAAAGHFRVTLRAQRGGSDNLCEQGIQRTL